MSAGKKIRTLVFTACMLAVAGPGVLYAKSPPAPRQGAAPGAGRTPRSERIRLPEQPSLELLAQYCHRIVVGQILAAEPPAVLTIDLDDGRGPGSKWIRKYAVKVTRVIKPGRSGPATRPASAQAASRPASAGGLVGSRIVVMDRVPPPGRPSLRRAAAGRHSFRIGAAYVLLLREIPGRTEYLARSFPRPNVRRLADAQTIRQVDRAAHPAKWPWGQPDAAGLQLAMMPTVRFSSARIFGISIVFALRNTSREAITVSLYRPDRYLSLWATARGGEVVRHDFYASLPAAGAPPPDATQRLTLKPGGWSVISPFGVSTASGARTKYAVDIRISLPPGKWALRAAYRSTRQAAGPAGKKLWKGKIESTPFDIHVAPPPTTDP